MYRDQSRIQKCYLISFLNYYCTVYSHIDLLSLWSDLIDPFFKIELGGNIKSEYIFYVDENYSTINRLLTEKFGHITQQILLHCENEADMYTNSDGEVLVIAKYLETAYMIEKHGTINIVKYICKEFGKSSHLDLFRLVRGVLEGLARQAGFLKVHMSAATLENRAIAFIGDAGAGKTSFMLSFLKNNNKAGFLANDKVLVNIDDSNIQLSGLPYAVSIGYGSLKCCDEILINQDTRIINEEVYLWPKELGSNLGREVVAFSYLAAIFIVKIDLNAEDLIINEIFGEEKYQFVKENVFCYSDKVTPYWLLNLLGLSTRQNKKVEKALLEKRMFKLYGNPWKSMFEEINNMFFIKED